MAALRHVALACDVEEELKWKQACYTHQGKNIFIISSFKDFCALNFFKGSLLKDPHGLLVKAGEHTQGGRQIRFKSLSDILKQEDLLKNYIQEAIAIEISGKPVENKEVKDIPFPEELEDLMKKDPAFKKAFLSLTAGRQRAYLMFFTAAKQSQTRLSRMEKYKTRILDGKGLNDCVCGLSKKMPTCDGSHKYI